MASPRDRQVIIIVIACLFLFTLVFVSGLIMHRLLFFVSLMNVLSGIIIVSYWLWNKLRPLKRITETRELVVLFAEVLVVALASHALITNPVGNWPAVVQYSIFIIHAVLLVLFLIFLLTFKIKKLF